MNQLSLPVSIVIAFLSIVSFCTLLERITLKKAQIKIVKKERRRKEVGGRSPTKVWMLIVEDDEGLEYKVGFPTWYFMMGDPWDIFVKIKLGEVETFYRFGFRNESLGLIPSLYSKY